MSVVNETAADENRFRGSALLSGCASYGMLSEGGRENELSENAIFERGLEDGSLFDIVDFLRHAFPKGPEKRKCAQC